MTNEQTIPGWSQCAGTAAKAAAAAAILFFLVVSAGHWMESSRFDGRFVFMVLLFSVALVPCALPPLALLSRGVFLFRRAQGRGRAVLHIAGALVLAVPLFFLWRTINAFIWDWLDVPIF